MPDDRVGIKKPKAMGKCLDRAAIGASDAFENTMGFAEFLKTPKWMELLNVVEV